MICLEFQHGRYQWDTELYRTFCSLYKGKTEASDDEKDFIMQKIKGASRSKSFRVRKIPVFSEEKNKSKSQYHALWRSTLNGYMYLLVNGARGHIKERDMRRTASKRIDHSFEITVEDLYEIYCKQSGRCHYSGICMPISGPFQISLERIDPFKGYCRDNIVLICDVFNMMYSL